MSDIDHTIKDVLHEQPKPAPVPEVAPEKEPGSAILFWALGIIAVLVIGIFAIRAFYQPEQPRGEIRSYGPWEFEHRNGLWETRWQVGNVELLLGFHHFPTDTLNVTTAVLPSWNNTEFDRDRVYLAIDPRPFDQTYVQLAATELAFKLAALGVNVSPAYTVSADGDWPDRPIKSCASKNESIIVITNAVNTSAHLLFENTCVSVSGGDSELVRAADRLLFGFYGIIPGFEA